MYDEVKLGQRVVIARAENAAGWPATVVEIVNRSVVRVRLEGELPPGALREFSIRVVELLETTAR